MDTFTVITLGGVGGMFVALVLLGLFYPGTGADQLGWRPTRSAELEAQNEVDDLDQMLAAANARRARRGKAPLTEEEVRADVQRQTAEQVRGRDDRLADLEVEQMLARKNARRRKRGLEEITAADFRAQLEREGRL